MDKEQLQIGNVHSIESFGTLDGPGVRTVVFLQGCPNRCKYCHNVDCAIADGGRQYSAQDLVAEVLRNKEYWSKGDAIRGGVTFSGGDPLFQPEFALSCAKLLKEENVHVAIDTSAFAKSFDDMENLVPYADLWMISIKHMDDEVHKDLIKNSNVPILKNITQLDNLLDGTGKQIRIRFVIIPGITDSEDHVKKLGEYIKGIKNLEKVELLPYTTIGRHKWIELFNHYDLDGVAEATSQDVERVKSILSLYVNKF